MRPEAEAFRLSPRGRNRTKSSELSASIEAPTRLLDAEAARAVWPSVDARALARAFDSLTSQELAFDTAVRDRGEAATAKCRGSATYTPKIGSREPRLESRQWTFQLRKVERAGRSRARKPDGRTAGTISRRNNPARRPGRRGRAGLDR